VVLLFLVVVWLVVLGPSVLRRVREGRGNEVDSVGTFHRELRILEHASPPFVPPAYRLRGGSAPAGAAGAPPLRAKPVLRLVNGEPLPPPALAFLGHQPAGEPHPGSSGRPDSAARGVDRDRGAAPTAPVTARREPDARRRVRQRRRDTLVVLLGVTFCSMVAGAFGVGGAWVLAVLAGLSATAYVGLLANLRARAEERERKLHYLERSVPGSGERRAAGLHRGDGRGRGHGAAWEDWEDWDEDEIAAGYEGVDLGELWASRLSHPTRAAVR
jgi:hypothetical protein